MTDIIETPTDPDIDDSEYALSDWADMDDDDEASLGFTKLAYKLIESDPRIQALRDEVELTPEQHADLRRTAMEIEQGVQHAHDDFIRLNPDASEAQVEEYIAAMFEHDVVTLDRIQKKIQRKSQEKEKEEAEANDRKESVAFRTTDTAQDGGAVENRFTGHNTVNGIRRILFGNQ